MIDLCKFCKHKSRASEQLSDTELSAQSDNCAECRFKKGDRIIRQGTLSSNVVFLREGLVKLHMTGPLHEQIIKLTNGPSYLGLPTTFGDKVNHYSATAIEDSLVCFIDLNTFRTFIMNNPNFAYELFIEQCINELNSYHRCVNRTQKQVSGSLAENLLFFADDIYHSDEFILPLSREELGNMIDASRESVCRTLNDFQNEGLIQIDSKKIKLLDKNRLQLISQYG